MTRRGFFGLLAVPFLAAWVPIRKLWARPKRVYADLGINYRYLDKRLVGSGPKTFTGWAEKLGGYNIPDLVTRMRIASKKAWFRAPFTGKL